jgi:VanZ family protein
VVAPQVSSGLTSKEPRRRKGHLGRECTARTLLPEEGSDMTKLVRLTRKGATLTALIIVVLSVMPGKMRPHLLGNDYCEHFIAYFVAGSLLAVGYPRPLQRLSSGVLLAIGAGSLELIQLWIPGRTSSVGGFVSAAGGAWIGVLIIVLVKWAHERKLVVSYK